jgi:predicted Zn-dependent peptidase
MTTSFFPRVLGVPALVSLASSSLAFPQEAARALSFPSETYRLENGLLVTLHPDHALPQVVVDTWYWVGSKDEAPGRTGFAHLFEHLMFMGTERVPGNAFDMLMEQGGGSNNASTSSDRTNYFSVGPSGLLETLLWLDADRLEALGTAMTQEKLDAQREVVRNERRQTSENTPYGKAELLLPGLAYPASHPYHHSVIGSHEDLEAATVLDVQEFFATYYTTTNASLVVAGDFDPEEAKALIQRTFGQVPRRDPPAHRAAPPASLAGPVRAVAYDRVEFEKLFLVWHSPAHYAPGDGELDLFAAVLVDGPSARLVQSLVHEQRLAQEVQAFQSSAELGSLFQIEALAVPGVALEDLKAALLEEVDALLSEGVSAAELRRVQAAAEADFRQQLEDLFERADRMNQYVRVYGTPDGFQRDLERWTEPTAEEVTTWAKRTLVPEHVDLRILPEGAEARATKAEVSPAAARAASLLDQRPGPAPRTAFTAPLPIELELKNGIALVCLPRPGTGLFAGALYGAGGPAVLARDKAGLAALVAELLGSGAAGKDAAEFAAEVASLGASIEARAERAGFAITVSGLSARLPETLDRLADVVLRPNFAAPDFEREHALLAAKVAARADDPHRLAELVARALALGREHPSGVPTNGYAATVAAIEPSDPPAAHHALLHAGNATLVFAGDFDPAHLLAELEGRFGAWQPARDSGPAAAGPVVRPAPGRLVIVDRPGAPQTMIYLARALAAPASERERAVQSCVETLFGRSFTSRLNQNLREQNQFTYGASCRLVEEGDQHLLTAAAAVHTPVTAAALAEFRREFDALATGNISALELAKARETVRTGLIGALETTRGSAEELAERLADGRSLDSLRRDLAALDQVTLDEANAFAKSGAFAWKDLVVVLVGDRAAVFEELQAAGFPEPESADVEGNL